MGRYVLGRVARLVVVFLIVSLGVTVLLDLVPGDPAYSIVGEDATPEQIQAVNDRYGFDDPLPVRYVRWLGDLVQGDLGASPNTAKPVWEAITERIPVTLELAFFSVVLAALIAIPLAVVTGYKEDSWHDRGVSAGSSAIVATPSFLMALALVWWFAVKLDWLPTQGWVRLTEDPVGNLEHALLPILSLALVEMVILQRVVRTDIIHTLGEDYVFAASAKGIPTRRILFRHALRPSLFSAITLIGISIGRLIGGTVIVEQIFALPGLGSLLLNAIATRDLITVQGVVAFMAIVYLVVNLLVDIVYSALDPRVAR